MLISCALSLFSGTVSCTPEKIELGRVSYTERPDLPIYDSWSVILRQDDKLKLYLFPFRLTEDDIKSFDPRIPTAPINIHDFEEINFHGYNWNPLVIVTFDCNFTNEADTKFDLELSTISFGGFNRKNSTIGFTSKEVNLHRSNASLKVTKTGFIMIFDITGEAIVTPSEKFVFRFVGKSNKVYEH